jgi:hypothetical protein
MVTIFAPIFVYLVVLSGHPLALFADPALPLATTAAEPWRFVSGALGNSAWPWLMLALAATGLTAVLFATIGLLSPRSKVSASLLGFGSVALVLAWVVAQLDFAAVGIGPATSDFVSGSPQALLGIWSLSMLLATATWLDTLKKRRAERLLATVVTAFIVLPAAAVTAVLTPNAQWSSGEVMPALISAQAAAGSQAQVLVISPDAANEGYSAAWIPVAGIQLEDSSVAYRFALAQIEKNDADYAAVAQLVADLVSSNSTTVSEALAKYSVGYVLVPKAHSQSEANDNARLAVALNSITAIEAAGETEFGKIWRVREFKSTDVLQTSSPWSVTKGVQLAVLLSFVLLAIPSANRRRAAASSEIFVDSGDGND